MVSGIYVLLFALGQAEYKNEYVYFVIFYFDGFLQAIVSFSPFLL